MIVHFYEVPIAIQDKMFSNGQLFYSPTATWIPEFFGKTPVVNGAVQPFRGSRPDLGAPTKTRYITLEEVLDAAGNPVRLEINGRMFEDAVDEAPARDTIEDWSFVNISADTHPIHMHLTNFQVKGRAPLDGLAYANALADARDGKPGAPPLLPNNTIDPTPYLLGPEVPAPANEMGWKDTVGAHQNQVTRIRQRFDLPEEAETSEFEGDRQYVYHCHILEHEDNDMMRPFNVV